MIQLYEVSTSSNSKKIRICARELDLELERISIDRSKGEDRTPEYLALNPMGKVPTLVDDGYVLWESGAIMMYLANKRPDKALWPLDLVGHTEVIRWTLWYTGHVQPFFNMLMQERVLKPKRGLPGNDQTIVGLAEGELHRYLSLLDQQLSSREYITGRFTIADIAVGVSIDGAPRVEFDTSRYPHIGEWVGRLRARPAWQLP